MKKLTLKDLRDLKPCYDPSVYLPEDWTGTIIDILDKKEVPFEDRLWCVFHPEFVSDKLARLFTIWCARQVQHLMKDDRSLNALDVAERFANGQVSKEDLAAARDAAGDATRDAQEKKLREMLIAGIETGDVK